MPPTPRAAWAPVLLALTLVPSCTGCRGENPWISRRVLNFAHQGGAWEAPSATLYGFKRAYRLGADVLELDVQMTRDGELVVIHDWAVDRTTNGKGKTDNLTVAEIQALDAAYWFFPGEEVRHDRGDGAYPLRGMATGTQAPLPGYQEGDFRIPTLREVFQEFPDAFINIELKESAYDMEGAAALAKLLEEFHRGPDTIVTSFSVNAIARFQFQCRNRCEDVSIGTGDVLVSGGQDFEADQVPLDLPGGTQYVHGGYVWRAHAAGQAVHVWTLNTFQSWERALAADVDGIMTDRPEELRNFLCARGVAYRPGVCP